MGDKITCWLPEEDNPYPLCIGRNNQECINCQLRAGWEPDNPYGISGLKKEFKHEPV